MLTYPTRPKVLKQFVSYRQEDVFNSFVSNVFCLIFRVMYKIQTPYKIKKCYLKL